MKLILANKSSSTEYPLTNYSTTLGSAKDVDIRLSGPQVVAYHAIIQQEDGKFSISGLDDRANVYVNDQPVIFGQILWPSDEIKLGSIKLVFQHDEATLETEKPKAPSASNEELKATALAGQMDQSVLGVLNTLDAATLETLRQRSTNIKPVSGLKAFLKQGLSQADSGQSKGIFGLMFTLPAISLTLYQRLRSSLNKSNEEAFPEGTWQFYTQFNMREDPARHANETDGFHRSITSRASEIDQATAWASRCITTLFEYETLLENEWVERTLLRLIHEAIAEAVADQITMEQVGINVDPNSTEFQTVRESIWQNEIERIEIQTEDIKRNFSLADLAGAWIKKRPYRKLEDTSDDIQPQQSSGETYPQYRRRLFLEFLAEAAERLPSTMGATIWDRYYELSSTALPAYQKQMSILYALQPTLQQDEKKDIPLWQARLGFVVKGRYYLLKVAHHDAQGRLLVFNPGVPDDPGEPLTLKTDTAGQLTDQNGRPVSVDRKGNITITLKAGQNQIKVIRPLPPDIVKAQISAILQNAALRTPATSKIDLELAQAPRAQLPQLVSQLPPATQKEIALFDTVPIIINWDQRKRDNTLQKIRFARRGIGHHALTIFRTESTFVFDQSHIFYDAIWGMMISQIITDGAIGTYKQVAQLSPATNIKLIIPLKLAGSRNFRTAIDPYTRRIEMATETSTARLSQINPTRKLLAQLHIPITVNDFLTLYRSLHDYFYVPGLALQRNLMQFRMDGHSNLVDEIEKSWQSKKREPSSLLLPMDASFVDPKLRLFPATFKNFLPDFAPLYEKTISLLDQITYNPKTETEIAFIKVRGQLMAYLLASVEYFKMLKHITRQGESLSTAAIKYLAHLPPGMQGTLDAIPQHIGALNEILKGEEVFSNVGRVAQTSSLVRFMSAKDDGPSKTMVWGIMCDRHGTLKVTLRDFRPPVAKLIALGREDLAELITQDYLEAYARGLNIFADDLAKIVTAQI